MRERVKNSDCDGNCSRFTNKATKSRCTKSFLQNLARPTEKTMYVSPYKIFLTMTIYHVFPTAN